jgi:hypothetical protein
MIAVIAIFGSGAIVLDPVLQRPATPVKKRRRPAAGESEAGRRGALDRFHALRYE